MSAGTAKRTGVNWLPATISVASVRMLMGIVMRSSRASRPISWW